MKDSKFLLKLTNLKKINPILEIFKRIFHDTRLPSRVHQLYNLSPSEKIDICIEYEAYWFIIFNYFGSIHSEIHKDIFCYNLHKILSINKRAKIFVIRSGLLLYLLMVFSCLSSAGRYSRKTFVVSEMDYYISHNQSNACKEAIELLAILLAEHLEKPEYFVDEINDIIKTEVN